MRKSKKITKTTIIDIAKASGVSISTVSRIINNKPDVSEETRERVLSCHKRTSFRPSGLLATACIWKKSFYYITLSSDSNQDPFDEFLCHWGSSSL